MISRHRKLWRWLLPLAVGLAFLRIIIPLSGTVDAIFSVMFIAILGTYTGLGMWEYHRERKADQSA
ncbi:MAG TPA: hypothetical protein VF030_04420 [Solirubrobacterales bacterium]